MLRAEEFRRFEDEIRKREALSLDEKFRLLDGLYEEARALGVFPPKDPLEGIEVDIEVAKVMASVSRTSEPSHAWVGADSVSFFNIVFCDRQTAELVPECRGHRVADELDRGGVPYMVMGGQAVLLYGEPRLTRDIDITVGLDSSEWDRIERIAQKVGLEVLVEEPEEFVKRTMVLPVRDGRSGIRVDFIFSNSLFERTALKRTKEANILGGAVRFASLEDVVVQKMVAGRARDMEDVRIMLLKNPDYDSEYIERWLHEFETALDRNLLEEFRRLKKDA